MKCSCGCPLVPFYVNQSELPNPLTCFPIRPRMILHSRHVGGSGSKYVKVLYSTIRLQPSPDTWWGGQMDFSLTLYVRDYL